MKKNGKKVGAALMAGVLCFTILSACSSAKPSASPETPGAGQESLPENTYELPVMGLTITLPEALMERMEREEVKMFSREIGTEDGSALQYGFLSWMVEAQEDDGAESAGNTYFEWENGLVSVGSLGVYQADMVDLLDELTGCDEHQELGQSADGTYKYYLSTSTTAAEELVAELRQIQTTITEMADFAQATDYDAPQSDFTGTSVGEFTTQDVNGNTYTQDIFQDYDLTLVNLFATWCSPCVAEMPDLEKLHQQMADRGVNVVGFVLDVLNEKGEIVQEDLERAQLLVERTGVTYPILLPDATYLNGRLTGIEAFPETFFVDKNGTIVGETYSGSGSLEDWLSVVEQELANLKEGA